MSRKQDTRRGLAGFRDLKTADIEKETSKISKYEAFSTNVWQQTRIRIVLPIKVHRPEKIFFFKFEKSEIKERRMMRSHVQLLSV